MLFEAFAAVVIGGVSLKGGYGRLSGVFAGVLLLSSIQTAINVWGLPPHYTQMIRGALVLAAVLLDTAENPHPEAVSMTGRLSNRVAIVIGAARGIGLGIAHRFVEEGARVVIGDTEASGEAAAAALGGADVARFVACDISKEEHARGIVETALAAFGRLDILVQNAGIYPWTLIENTSADEWDRVLAVNLKGCFLAARAALEPMRQAGYGRLVFISSITGPRVSSPGHGHYSASKAGINGFIRAAAIEFAGYGITVNGVEPGNILTEGMKLAPQPRVHQGDGGHGPTRPPRHATGRRQRRPLPRLRRGGLHHRHDDHRRRRPDPAGGSGFPDQAGT